MKIKRIDAYVEIKKQSDEVRFFIPSGFQGQWIVIEETTSYELGIAYLPLRLAKVFRNARRKFKEGGDTK